MDKFREFIIAGTYMSVTLQDKNLQKFFVACSKIENTLITGDHVHAIEIAAVEQLKAELEKVQQDKASNDSDYLKLSAENNALKARLLVFEGMTFSESQEIAALKSKLEIAVEALNTALNYLHWREDDLIGDDCKGDGKLTSAYKNRVSEIEQALKEIEG